MTLPQLCTATQALASHAFRPGTSENHLRQAKCFMDFCQHYHLQFLLQVIPTVCYYITHRTTRFTSANNIRKLHIRNPHASYKDKPHARGTHLLSSQGTATGCRHYNAAPPPNPSPSHPVQAIDPDVLTVSSLGNLAPAI